MPVMISDVLSTPVLRDARVVAGKAGVDVREVRWAAVIEWPVEDFVRRGDLVLTTGLACDVVRFEQLAREIADSDAAGLLVSMHQDSPLREVPDAVVALADERAFPVVLVPWDVRFAEIMMAVTDQVIAQQYAAVLQEPDRLLERFAGAVLAGNGMGAIAEALERMLLRPVIILGTDLRAVGHGALAADRWAGELAGWSAAIEQVPSAEIDRLKRELDAGSPLAHIEIPGVGVAPGALVAASGRRGTLGYVYVAVDNEAAFIPSLESRAISHAAMAVAMEMLRLQAAAEAEARVRGDFLWGLALGGSGTRQELAAKAALLGYDLRVSHHVALAHFGTGDATLRSTRAERLADELQHKYRSDTVVSRQGEYVLMLRSSGTRDTLRELLEAWQERCPGEDRPSWGVAQDAVTLLDLDRGYQHALRALEVGGVVHGPGSVADAYALGPYLLLDVLSQDPSAVSASRAVLEPILEYDDETSRNLLVTLEVYLRENGNTSAAARILYLNRHSLTYRLRKIESLTGRSLERYEDRFMLDLSAKVLRLVERRNGEFRS
jgi:purine catabolism regulator